MPSCADFADIDSIQDSGGAQIEPDCTRTGEFAVELGQGEAGFEPLDAGEQPTLHFGAQGGTHLVLAARVVTPDPLDRYEISLLAEAGQDCTLDACATYRRIGGLELVLEGDAIVVGEGEIEIPRLFLIVDGWASAVEQRLTLEVADACGRHATNQRSFVP